MNRFAFLGLLFFCSCATQKYVRPGFDARKISGFAFSPIDGIQDLDTAPLVNNAFEKQMRAHQFPLTDAAHADAIVSVTIHTCLRGGKSETKEETDTGTYIGWHKGISFNKDEGEKTEIHSSKATADFFVQISDPKHSELLWSRRVRTTGKDLEMVVASAAAKAIDALSQ